jgi:PAS domain S-box-containing protein
MRAADEAGSPPPAGLSLGVLENLLEGCQVIGFDFRYLYLNEAAARHGHTTREALLGRPMTEAFPGIDRTEMYARLGRCLEERVHLSMENEFTYPDGSTGWFELNFVPVPEGAAILSHDITARRQAEEHIQHLHSVLQASEARYRELVENLDDVVFRLDTEGRFSYVSPAVARFGYTPEEFLNLHFWQFVHPEDLPRAVESFMSTLDGRSDPIEIRAFDKQGKLRVVRASGRAVTEAGRPLGTAGILVDVTEQRATEAQLRLSQRLESVGRLAGGVAHDFNNMLTVIISYTEFAIDAVKKGDPLRQDLEQILKAGRRAAALTYQLLAFSRKQVLEPKVIDLNEIIEEMGEMLKRLLGDDIVLEVRPQTGLGKTRADPSQIEQVIVNLVINSRDAMVAGGRVTIETANVELDEGYANQHTAVAPGPYVMIAVTDTGVGMDSKTREQAFEPFFTTKETGKGTGLGLSTVYGIVKQSGGNIWVYSEPGQGTTFKIYLPMVLTAAETTARAASVESRPGGAETILVVEDEEAVRDVSARILTAAGYMVLSAASGGEALLICEQHQGDIHLLLTDVVMPRMSGRELAERLAKLRPGMKVLYMSGYTDNSIVHHGVLDEGTHFLGKPINALVLTRKVREVLDG